MRTDYRAAAINLTYISLSQRLPNHLQRELNLSGGRTGRSQQACSSNGCSRGIKDSHIIGGNGHRKVSTIQNIENLCPELHVEVLRAVGHRLGRRTPRRTLEKRLGHRLPRRHHLLRASTRAHFAPRRCPQQSVDTVRCLIGDNSFGVETFKNRSGFLVKAQGCARNIISASLASGLALPESST